MLLHPLYGRSSNPARRIATGALPAYNTSYILANGGIRAGDLAVSRPLYNAPPAVASGGLWTAITAEPGGFAWLWTRILSPADVAGRFSASEHGFWRVYRGASRAAVRIAGFRSGSQAVVPSFAKSSDQVGLIATYDHSGSAAQVQPGTVVSPLFGGLEVWRTPVEGGQAGAVGIEDRLEPYPELPTFTVRGSTSDATGFAIIELRA